MWPDSSVVRVLARSPRGAGFESLPGHVFFLAFDIWWPSVGPCSGCKQQRDGPVGSGMVPSRFGDESI